uniref:Uncharacterized protein n=1 Tax=Rhizophora mucronata TaxID=61149 RepID=A0A2P2IT54_RHIMU
MAVLHSKEKLYNLVYQKSLEKHYMIAYTDNDGSPVVGLILSMNLNQRLPHIRLQVKQSDANK